MVFENFVLSTQQPRIALLGLERRRIEDEVANFPIRQFSVENRQQLHAGNPAVVAESLMDLCSASRDVATRYLARPGGTIKPPRHEAALMGLGLSLASDAYWLPNDVPALMEVLRVGGGIVEEGDMESVMISFDVFERLVHATASPPGVVENGLRLGITFLQIFYFFHGVRNLIIMVDLPRRHHSWDQIRVVGTEDSTRFEMDDENLRARCLSVFQRYETLHYNVRASARVLPGAIEGSESSGDDDSLSDRNQRTRMWPELSFAFLKS